MYTPKNATTASAITISRLEYIFRYIFDVIFYIPNLAIEDQQRAEEAANNHIRQNRDLPAGQWLANMFCFLTCKLISMCFSCFALYVFSDTIQIILKYMTQSSPTHTKYEYDLKKYTGYYSSYCN
uniref:Uncharacterized protein n=1 Tax=Aureoumbra lagunensis TaxID=44058 RepID=A0A7S3NNM0_9STRA